MALITPTADLAIAWTPQVVQGQAAIIADIPLTPQGDAAQVVGAARLQQSIQWVLAIPVGAYFALPSWGNRFWAQIGRPTSADDETYISMAQATEADFLQQQAIAAAQGYLSLDEQIDQVVGTSIDRSQPGRVGVGIKVKTRAGATLTASQPFTD